MAAVFVSFKNKPTIEQIKERWASFSGEPQALGLPLAPKQFLHYFEEPDRPQTRLDRDLEKGMAVSMDGFVPTPSMTINLSAFPIIPCAEPQAVRS